MEQVPKGISLKADGPVNGCNTRRENRDDHPGHPILNCIGDKLGLRTMIMMRGPSLVQT